VSRFPGPAGRAGRDESLAAEIGPGDPWRWRLALATRTERASRGVFEAADEQPSRRRRGREKTGG
jgi:hypothetical protein